MTRRTATPTLENAKEGLSMTLAAPFRMTRHDCPHVVASGVFVVMWKQFEGHQVQVALCQACVQARQSVALAAATR